jgi:SAM-dependent methyltransferase
LTQDYKKTWNDRYGGGEYIFGKEPNQYFQSKLSLLTPGTIYLPGDGEGRNAVYAAKKNWEVTSADFSTVALQRAEEFAKIENVKIDFQFMDLINEDVPKNKYDVLAVSYLHFNGKNKEVVHKKLGESVKVGGHLILECFSEKQIALNSGGPRKKDSLYTVNELKKYYSGFEFLEAEDILTQLNEGEGHQGDAYVVRLFARKIGNRNE